MQAPQVTTACRGVAKANEHVRVLEVQRASIKEQLATIQAKG